MLACSKKPIFQSKYDPSNAQQTTFSSSSFDSLQPTSDGKFFYGVSNNERNVTIRLKVADATDQRKMLFLGFTVWIDNKAKEKRTLGVTFPSALNSDDHSMQETKGKGHNFSANLKNLVNNVKLETQEYIGFKSTNNVFADINADDKGYLYYQVTIPYNAIYENPSDKKSQIISVGFESGKPHTPSSEGMSSGDDEGRSSGGGGMGGGMGGRGGMGGGMGGRGGMGGGHSGGGGQGSFEPVKTWIKVKLVQ